MSKLNEKNERTEKIIHILVTNLCNRNCEFCCNKQYDMNTIPYVTDEELRNAEVLCLTGGEPFKYTEPNAIASYYKRNYSNIKKVYVYTNALEFAEYLLDGGALYFIDRVNVSIKVLADAIMFEKFIKHNEKVQELSSNLLYIFNNLYSEKPKGFTTINREWQEEFEPANDSIFRRC